MSQRHRLSFLSSRTERTPDVGGVGRMTTAHLGMLLWALFVGLSFPAVGLLSEGLPPLLLTAMRFVIAALVLAVKQTAWVDSSTSRKRSTASRARSMVSDAWREGRCSECGLPKQELRKSSCCAASWDSP